MKLKEKFEKSYNLYLRQRKLERITGEKVEYSKFLYKCFDEIYDYYDKYYNVTTDKEVREDIICMSMSDFFKHYDRKKTNSKFSAYKYAAILMRRNGMILQIRKDI